MSVVIHKLADAVREQVPGDGRGGQSLHKNDRARAVVSSSSPLLRPEAKGVDW